MELKHKKGRVISVRGQRIVIYTDDGFKNGILSGKLKQGERTVSPVATGDYISFLDKSKSLVSIEKIYKRKKCISRPAVEKEGMLQIIVANVDRLVVIVSTVSPRFNHGAVDRFLLTSLKENIQPVIVLNKIDLKGWERFSKYLDPWRNIGCKIILTSAKTGEGVKKLRSEIETGTSVIAGHSGVGKSSLLNRIDPELKLKTKTISKYSGKGVHTTTSVTLYKISDAGWVADTPGLKVLSLAGITRDNLRLYYPEFLKLSNQCFFNDCKHIDEPNCAVKNSLDSASGEITEFRYKSYLRIRDSLKK
jgi:ribosome biogenesis GTPase